MRITISHVKVQSSQTSHYMWAEGAQHSMLPPRRSEELLHVHPLGGSQSAAGQPSYASPITQTLHSTWAPDSHSPVAQGSQGMAGKGECGLRPLHRPLQGHLGRTCTWGAGWEGRIQVWRMEWIQAATAEDVCKDGAETCKGDHTYTGTENKCHTWQ